ncbi:MAG: hypothetical protein HYZ49_11730 [Chloroflexi bacterium]|nr:hypothetical protein [Chloroflexota bacterium]
MNTKNLMRSFNPARVAFYEKENYVAYYQKRWLRLLRVSVGMVKESFSLSWPQAVYAAYLVARAEIAFAPFPTNNVPLAEAYMRRFYTFIKKVHHLEFDVEQVARLDVKWWEIHRRLFGDPQNQELVEAVAALYAATYGVELESVREAAYHRVQGMLYSDYWVNAGKPENSPLLAQEEEALLKSYTILREALAGKPTEAMAVAA